MINCVYYNDYIRCYRDGRVERLFRGIYWKNYSLTINKEGYYRIKSYENNFQIHRLIAFCFLGLENINGTDMINEIDHINRMRNDNRVENLRIVSKSQNQWNRGAKGCSYMKKLKKWTAYININKKRIHLGCYDTEEDARNAYLRAKEQYHII